MTAPSIGGRRPQGRSSPVRPLIGLTPDTTESPQGRPFLRLELRSAYFDALAAAGALPILLPLCDGETLGELVGRLDGLVLTGGAFDIPPSEYGEAPAPGLGELKPERTTFEKAALEAAERRGLPILGICGGMQLLAVTRGGKLYQHLPTDLPGPIAHEQAADRRSPSHTVKVVPKSRLAAATGSGDVWVNSSHHQGVRLPGRGLVATAVSPDGLVEAIEDPAARYLVGVQWHPELLAPAEPGQRAIFEGLVAACGH